MTTLIRLDGFEQYGSPGTTDRRLIMTPTPNWSASTGGSGAQIRIGNGRLGGRCLNMRSADGFDDGYVTYGTSLTMGLPSNNMSYGVGFWVKAGENPTTQGKPSIWTHSRTNVAFVDILHVMQWSQPTFQLCRVVYARKDANNVDIPSGGFIGVTNNAGNFTSLQGNVTWYPDDWNYVELDFILGLVFNQISVSIYINGVQLGTSASLGAGLRVGNLLLFSAGNGNIGIAETLYDDFYVSQQTTQGISARIAGSIGRTVQNLTPSGAGNSTQLTPLSANPNHQIVARQPYNDTDYVSGTAGLQDLYEYTNLAGVNEVHALVFATRAAHNGVAISRQNRARIGGTDYDIGSSAAVALTYAETHTIATTSPATASAWTPAEVNGAQFGVQAV